MALFREAGLTMTAVPSIGSTALSSRFASTIPLPRRSSTSPRLPTNTACFEGGLFHRDVVSKIGFPDKRFFIYWDDCISRLSREQGDGLGCRLRCDSEAFPRGEELGGDGVRQLNSSSDMTRFYIMRNRGYMARYLKLNGDYNPVGYALGTVLSFCEGVHPADFGRSLLLQVRFEKAYRGMEGVAQDSARRELAPMPAPASEREAASE